MGSGNLECRECGLWETASTICMAAHSPDRPLFAVVGEADRKSTRLNSSHVKISYAVFCLKKKMIYIYQSQLFSLNLYSPQPYLHSFPTRRSSDLRKTQPNNPPEEGEKRRWDRVIWSAGSAACGRRQAQSAWQRIALTALSLRSSGK